MASSKPIQEQIYKSRLTITYRTTITGTLQQENLPFRILVLGELAGRSLRDAKVLDELANRPVRSIKRGTTVDDHLNEVVPVWRIPKDVAFPRLQPLRSFLPGTAKLVSIKLTVPTPLQEKKAVQLSGTVLYNSDHTVNGMADFEDQPLKVSGTIDVTPNPAGGPLTFGKATIHLSGVAQADDLDPATRMSLRKVVGLADPLDVTITIADASTLVKSDDEDNDAGNKYVFSAPDSPWDVQLERVLSITSMDSFSPDEIAASIPEIERTQLLKKLLSHVQAELRNRPDLRNVIKTKLVDRDPGALDAWSTLQTWVNQKLWTLKLDVGSGPPGAPTDAAGVKKLQESLDAAAAAAATAATAADAAATAAASGDPAAKKTADDAKTAADAAKTAADADAKSLKDAVTAAATADAAAKAAPTDAAAKKAADDATAAVTKAATDVLKKQADARAPAVKRLQSDLIAPVLVSSSDLYTKDADDKPTDDPWAIVRPLATTQSSPLKFHDRDVDISDGAWVMNGLAVLLANADLTAAEICRIDGRKLDPGKPADPARAALRECLGSYPQFLNAMTTLMKLTDDRIRGYVDSVYHHPHFQALEAAWQGLSDLARSVESDDVLIDFLDVSKDELRDDVVDHDLDMFSGILFDKVYVGEYDRYGGKPFASMIGLYEFDSVQDIAMLRALGRVANASHCPFVGAASPTFFSPYKTMEEVANVSDLDAILSAPQFGKWQELRDTEYAAYLGLTLPRYLVREPWRPEARGNDLGYRETVPFATASLLPEDRNALLPADDTAGKEDALKSNLLWGNAAILFAKNMVASYQSSGWAQHIRGPIGGGLCEGLVSYQYTRNGYAEIQPPVEIVIPDYRELQFATNGFIPLVHKKGEALATFFSSQSIKKPKRFVEDLSTKNAALVTNLAYTFSITRIAHYVKRMMREYIGAAADDVYIQQVLSAWLGQYVTLVTNPDDVTLRSYPFKAATVAVEKKPGPLGWYKAIIQILPHVQFEGMDVELRLEAALGGP